VVEGGAAARRDAPTRLVVSGSERDEADQHPAFAPDRRRGGTGCAYIPKPDGRQRPLGIAALEDKVVQRAVVEVLNAIYE
jgi:hypothetical protein